VTPSRSADPTFTVLLVCTGNICRSAFAERLGRAFVDAGLGEDAHLVRVTSAGTRAVVGSSMHPATALVLQGFGGDPSGFVARQLSNDMINGADLVLSLTSAHRSAVLQDVPGALSRTFTLSEAASLITSLAPRTPPSGEGLAERGRSLVQAMVAIRSRRLTSDVDVPDPIGRSLEFHQEVAEVIAAALIPVLQRLVSLQEPVDGVPRPVPVSERGGLHSADQNETTRSGFLRRSSTNVPR
jgi:protein-tyrosine-phosphatase